MLLLELASDDEDAVASLTAKLGDEVTVVERERFDGIGTAPPNSRRQPEWQEVERATTSALNDHETIVAHPIRHDLMHKIVRLRADYGEQLAADPASAADFASEVDRLTGWAAERASV
jgi:hypothetical protein